MDSTQATAVKPTLRKAIVSRDRQADLTTLAGKSVLITGGASGLGAGLTGAFAETGAWVTVLDIKIPSVGPNVIQECIDAGQHVQFVQCDVTSYEQQKEAFRKAATFNPDRHGLDHVCSLAGVAGPTTPWASKAFGQAGSEPADPFTSPTAIDISLKGGFYTVMLGMHWMGQEVSEGAEVPKDKSIIIMGSRASYYAIAQRGDYTAAKFGLRGLFKAWRSATALAGVRLNLIAPGYIETPLLEGRAEQIRQAGYTVGKIEDVVGPTLLCCADNTITGRSLSVGFEGLFDMRDDLEGQDATEVMQQCELSLWNKS